MLNIAAMCRQLVDETLQSGQTVEAGAVTICLQLDLANDGYYAIYLFKCVTQSHGKATALPRRAFD